MTNAREMIFETLHGVTGNVHFAFPEDGTTMPLITYAEITNTHTGLWQDRIEYQVDAYAESFGEVVELCEGIDGVMAGLGFQRTYATSDTLAREDEHFHKAMNYVANVNTHEMNIMQEG